MSPRLALLGLIWAALFVGAAPGVWAQADGESPSVFRRPARYSFIAKGKMFMQWGYNRAGYTRSDLHIAGPGFGLTVHEMVARDRPSEFKLETYFTPAKMWIPQYNYRVGVFITNRWSLSVGLDHMKYVMVPDQIAKVTGSVSASASILHAGSYDHVSTRIGGDFLRFEHSDGLNYLSAEADWHQPLYTHPEGWVGVYAFGGAGVGAVICRTDAHVFDRGMNTRFHPAGFGISGHVGAKVFFLKHFYINAAAKGGFISLTDILLHNDRSSLATQNFGFGQVQVLFGAQFRLWGGGASATN